MRTIRDYSEQYDITLKPVTWWVDDSGDGRTFWWVPRENLQGRVDGIDSGAVSLSEVPENWWTDPEMLGIGQYTSDNGRHWRPLTREDFHEPRTN